MENKSTSQELTMYIRNIEQTVYGQLFIDGIRVKVTTVSGREVRGKISVEPKYPGGIWIARQNNEDGTAKKGTFIPFTAIDNLEITG